jgi:hypothetical protein
MAKGAFVVFQDTQNPRDIHFEVRSTESVPEDQLSLRDGIDRTLTVLQMLFPEPHGRRYREYYQPLLSLAQAGLVGDTAQPGLAARALVTFREEVTAREAGKVKNKYMRILGKYALWLGGLPLLAGLSISHSRPGAVLGSFLLLWSGCMAGVWLSYGARKTLFRFEDLNIPEEDRLEPWVRLIFTGLLSLAFGLLFSTGAVSVTIGKISTEEFVGKTQVALLIGLILGFSEQTLPTALAARAASFFPSKS